MTLMHTPNFYTENINKDIVGVVDFIEKCWIELYSQGQSVQFSCLSFNKKFNNLVMN